MKPGEWRIGRHNDQIVYVIGPTGAATDSDAMVAVFMDAADAADAVEAYNNWRPDNGRPDSVSERQVPPPAPAWSRTRGA